MTDICCCSASIWAKIIAIFQIILYVIPTVKLVYGLFVMLIISDAFRVAMEEAGQRQGPERDQGQAQQNLGVVDVTLPLYNFIIVLVLVLFFQLVPGLVMGILLFLGTHQKRTGFLTAWTVYAVLCILFFVILVLMGAIVTGLVLICIFTSAICVVQIVRRDIQNDQVGQGMVSFSAMEGGGSAVPSEKYETEGFAP